MSQVPRKQEADYSDQVNELETRVNELVSSGNIDEAVSDILALEKKARNASDNASTGRLLTKLVWVLYDTKRYKELNEKISTLTNKHGQLKNATQQMIDAAIVVIEKLDGDAKWDLVNTIREVTDGKIYLEIQRATVTRLLAKKKEEDHHIEEACQLLAELQVETFGSMEIKVKTDYILEQMRLLAEIQDWETLGIVSKRINLNWIKDDEDLQLRFYNLMITHGIHTEQYLDVANYYLKIYLLPSINDNVDAWMPALRNIAYFVILAPYNHEQHDLLHRVFKQHEFRLQKIPIAYAMLDVFAKNELMRWPGVMAQYGTELQQSRVFGPDNIKPLHGDIEASKTPGLGPKRLETLHTRLTEHNIRVIEAYYSRITLARLAQLLDLPVEDTDSAVANLVTSGTVYARIDRPAGTVDFRKPKRGTDVLNEWSYDVSKLLSLVEDATHLIAKELSA